MAKARQLQCVEMRPDLLLEQGFAFSEVLAMVAKIKALKMECLFTLRRHDHGGKFRGTHTEQMQLSLQAVERGAGAIDVEWDSECAAELIASKAQVILSHHDFDGMPSSTELSDITERIAAKKPAAIKIVPTAKTFEDAVRMLQWVHHRQDGPQRIGFAMGKPGMLSRILTCAFGSPITYAAFSAPVAPGQVAIDELLWRYRAGALNANHRIVGIAGKAAERNPLLEKINSRQKETPQPVGIPLDFDDFQSVKQHSEFLRMDHLLVYPSHVDSLPENLKQGCTNEALICIDLANNSRCPAASVIDADA